MKLLFKLDNRLAIKATFWAHMLVAAFSHVAVVLMVVGAFNLVLASEGMSFWTKGMLYGLLFFSGMYGVNHVTNQDGFCFLTDLENHLRRRENLPEVGRFMPRFYHQVRSILRLRK